MKPVNFHLQRGYKGKTYVSMSYYFPGGRYRKMLPWPVDARHWSETKHRVKYSHPDAQEINRALDSYTKRISDLYWNCIRDGIEITEDMIRQAVSPGKIKASPGKDFRDLFSAWLDGLAQAGELSRHTIISYREALKSVLRYSDPVRLDRITPDYVEGYRAWMVKHGFSDSTIWNRLSCLKVFLRKMKVGVDIPKVRVLQSAKVYLSVSDLDKLVRADLPGENRAAADAFLIQAYTGMRYSDLKHFKMENIRSVHGAEMIFIKQAKTGGDVVIPLHPVVRAVLDRNKGVPPVFHLGLFNVRLREACRLAGITDKIVHYSRKSQTVVEKWELVSSHTGRRSAATNMHIAGVDSGLIMRLTGHKDERSFRRYLRIDNEESALLLSRSSFFK